MKYGDIYWAKPDPSVGSEQDGRRPVLVISADEAIEAIPSVVTTVPLTSRSREWVTHVPMSGSRTGLGEATWAMCEQMRTISTQRLAGKVGEADPKSMQRVNTVLRYLLNLD